MKAVEYVRAESERVKDAARYAASIQMRNYFSREGIKLTLKPIEYHGMTYAEQRQRDEYTQKLLNARTSVDTLPKCLRVIIYKLLDDIENYRGQKAAAAHLINNIALRTIPRLRLVNSRYLITDNRFIPLDLKYQFNKLTDLNRDEQDRLAFDITLYIDSEVAMLCDERANETPADLALINYRHISKIVKQFNQEPPNYKNFSTGKLDPDSAISALMRMSDHKWWKRKLKRFADSWSEHLFIAFGSVSKRNSAYCSQSAKQSWAEQKRRTQQYLEMMELEDEEGNRIPLIDKANGSNSNPEIRRCEMMARIRGFENISLEMGYSADFYTLTAPSKYHATTKLGYKNHKWQGASPSDTQKYLCGIWASIRAKLARDDIPVFGIRVAEPHHDGTPHWHMLIFMQKEHVEAVRNILRDYATREDENELVSKKAQKARFHVEEIDPEKGSATGYVAKYVSKNINGFALDGERDNDTGELLTDTAVAAMAWAARWRIRQFQFIGGAPVTIYRELRRLADSALAKDLDLDFAAVHDAADNGNFGEYTKAQGGPFVKRADLIVKIDYEKDERTNSYGEEIKRVFGVSCSRVIGTTIKTRLKKWKIVCPQRDSALGVDLALKGDFSPSWSSVNNCTEYNNHTNHDQRKKIEFLVRSRGVEPDKRDIDCLLRGSTVFFDDKIKLKVKNNEVIESSYEDYWRFNRNQY